MTPTAIDPGHSAAPVGPALVLAYHRVCDVPVDPWGLCVSPPRFAEHLEVLRRDHRVVTVRELAAAQRRGVLPARTVAVTLDDGYCDVLKEAAPLLERAEVPATVFLVSGKLDTSEEFWWDELERIFLHPGVLPQVLELRLAGVDHRWDLGGGAVYGEAAFATARHWAPWSGPDPTSRQTVFLGVWENVQRLSQEERADALGLIRQWAWPEGSPEPRVSHRALTSAEVGGLSSSPLFEIGAHTRTHPALGALDADHQRFEIERSKQELETLIDGPVHSFAYPYGRRCDYSELTVELVRAAGFTAACSNFGGLVFHESDRFQIPRLHVGDWDGVGLARRLATAFGNV